MNTFQWHWRYDDKISLQDHKWIKCIKSKYFVYVKEYVCSCWDRKKLTWINKDQIDTCSHCNTYLLAQKTFLDVHTIFPYIFYVLNKFKNIFQNFFKIIKFSWIMCFWKFPWHIRIYVWPISAGTVRTIIILLEFEKLSLDYVKLSFWSHLDPLNEFYGGKKPRGFLAKSL